MLLVKHQGVAQNQSVVVNLVETQRLETKNAVGFMVGRQDQAQGMGTPIH